jgi:mitosis inhibitor protein kinase SWE1
MIMLETAANIVVPDQGEPWHRLRHEDFSQVDDMDASPELFALIRAMMRAEPAARLPIAAVHGHAVVARARAAMERQAAAARAHGTSLYAASPLAGVEDGFLEAILGRPAMLGPSLARVDEDDDAMDLSA